MKNKQQGIIAVVLLVAVLSISMVAAFRADSDNRGALSSSERCTAMQTSFENLDYESWKELMQTSSKGRVLDVVNKENFDLFVQAHQAAQSGDYELARQLKEQIGLFNSHGPRDGSGRGLKHQHTNENYSGKGYGRMR